MHELLAVCLLAVDRDSIDSDSSRQSSRPDPLSPRTDNPGMEDAMMATLDRRFVEHDAFGLFQEVMKGAKPLYEWRAEEGPVRKLHLKMGEELIKSSRGQERLQPCRRLSSLGATTSIILSFGG